MLDLTQFLAPGDIAIYGALCALATFPRPSIQSQLLENDHFGVYIEQEPYVRELIDAYMGSRFKTVLEILDRFSVRLPSHPVYSYVMVLTCNYGRLDISWTSS